MAEIKEVFEDIKDTLGNKGFLILMIGAGAFGLYNLLKSEEPTGEQLTTVTSVASYPDAVTNANVIIDTLQNSIDYSEQAIREDIAGISQSVDNIGMDLGSSIEGWGNDLENYLNQNFEATNNYINEGLESMEKLQNTIDTNTYILGDLSDNETAHFKNLMSFINGTNQDVKDLIVDRTSGVSVPKSSNKNDVDVLYYAYNKKAGLNTDTSIVDALKASKVDSSFENRKKIANANGIKNYTGTYEQNVTMLNMLKSGKLKAV